MCKTFNLDPRQSMFLGMMQIITPLSKWYLYHPIILRTPFINAIYPFTTINAKGFSATYEDRNISYNFITDPISRDINVLIDMKQKHVDSLQFELMDRPWVTKARGRDNYRGWGRSSPGSSRLSYRSSSSSPILQRGGMSLINSRISQKEASSSIHLEDISKNNPLYAQIHAYLSQKQSDTFASIAKEDIDDINTGSAEFQHFSGYNTSENAYNFSKMIIKQIIFVEDWGMSTMKDRQISLNKVSMNFTYWDYIHAFDKVLIYNNERHKHTWFIKICAKIFAEPIRNWFLNWWSYHVSPDLNKLYNAYHICYLKKFEQIYFFIEFSIPWIHKWTLKVRFTEEQIPCLYRIFYNNFWDKLMKRDPKTKSLYGHELLDLIEKRIQKYSNTPQKGIIQDSLGILLRKISIQEGNKEETIN
ncbi:hypothetical protein H5410_003853 [Solanum commersonii]|uniref:Uncharacterized protein n=1 Tax=Solanum commersonii TaxID=4109 RepID=A0A9J6B662_SOLCO|nr:hypothetical protein H5410_003853 [Solanum commersonii]